MSVDKNSKDSFSSIERKYAEKMSTLTETERLIYDLESCHMESPGASNGNLMFGWPNEYHKLKGKRLVKCDECRIFSYSSVSSPVCNKKKYTKKRTFWLP
ncbi:hypothetical protein ACOME3_009382 [Neoechinorhynchus agilis]